jgi:Flp pilus assembly protein, ATPase CpaF
MNLAELLISCFILVCVVLYLYFIFKAGLDNEESDNHEKYSIGYLCSETKKMINDIINTDLDLLNLNKNDYENRKALKRSLSNAVRKCSQGYIAEKMIVMARIKSILTGNLEISEEVIDVVFPFHHPDRLTAADQFEILMYQQKHDGNHRIFGGICQAFDLDMLKKDEDGYYYCVTQEDIAAAYTTLYRPLSYDDKLNVLTQRIYEETFGLSVVDLMIMEDDSLDSVSGGVSGVTIEDCLFLEEDLSSGSFRKQKTYESVWIVYGGKSIHMKFLSFQSNTAIIRICKNLSEHGCIGHLTSSEGGLKTHLADGSRVTIFRPNNGSQWAFFVRKFASASASELKDLITDQGCEYPIEVIKWGIHGCLNLVFSGDQNSGKTTNTRAAVREIDRRQPIRTIEADFELYLNDAYYDKNILGTRPSEKMSFPRIIELLKSSEAHTILFGETASLEHAKHLIDLLLAGTKRIITTGHWPTTDELISYFVHAMGAYGSSGMEEVEAMVARLLHLDIHCVKENDGHRHIDRITEIIPVSDHDMEPDQSGGIEGRLDLIAKQLKLLTKRKTYECKDVIVYEEGKYRMINPISERLSKIIIKNLPPEERTFFLEFNKVPERCVDKAC